MRESRKLFLLLVICLPCWSGCALMMPARAATAPEFGRDGWYRGITHVHTEFSGDSVISLKNSIKTAEKAGLDFVVVTDHNTISGRKVYREGNYRRYPLLVFGMEISTLDGHILALGVTEDPPKGLSAQQYVDWIHAQGGFAAVAHPGSVKNPWRDWDVKGFDGLEVYNFGHAFYPHNKLKLGAQMLFLSPRSFLRSVQRYPEASINIWNREMTSRPAFLLGGTDAHVRFDLFGWSPEDVFLYFQSVSTYVLAEELNEAGVVGALVKGRSFIAFESRGNASGFSFTASEGVKEYQMGDKIPPGPSILFSVTAPEPAEIRLFHREKLVRKTEGTKLRYEGREAGPYRAEAHREGGLWILSNAIYVEA